MFWSESLLNDFLSLNLIYLLKYCDNGSFSVDRINDSSLNEDDSGSQNASEWIKSDEEVTRWVR